MSYKRSLVWLRRDLRLDDHAAIYEACRQSDAVAITFVVSPALLAQPDIGGPIVNLFFSALRNVRRALEALSSDIVVLNGDFAEELSGLCKRLNIDAVFYSQDTDPRAKKRDAHVTETLEKLGVKVHAAQDLLYFPPNSITQDSGRSYRMFTPYKRRWLALREHHRVAPYASAAALKTRLIPGSELGDTGTLPLPEHFHIEAKAQWPLGSEKAARQHLKQFLSTDVTGYADRRNFPAIDGTSQLSPQLRAGTIGIRTCVEAAYTERAEHSTQPALGNIDTWISELIWREFYHQILVHYPHVVDQPFDARATNIRWVNDRAMFAAWSEARTGYPLVDAAMRQLHANGWMHNRLRMIVASFLTKDLLVDYRWGEQHFMEYLADGDTAANNGGWQWAASTGTDSVPYFRIFHPVTQSKQFDPEGNFLRRMLPELRNLPASAIHAPWMAPPLLLREAGVELGVNYPLPIVDHASARLRALDAFGSVFGKGTSA